MRRIASGGMAEVWMGRRRAMGGASKTVAIKLLASHLVNKPVYRRMFVDEARLTMMLTHSNIVQVFDVGEHEGRGYLVMEWVDGLDLSQLAASVRERGEALELHVIAHLIGEVLRGLAYAHGLTEGDESSAIVHRDISPHNVLISVSGEVKVSDFGVARLATEETSGVHVRGKLRYMPPEQLRGNSRHATTDLFAVGAMMQELLDGVRFRAGCDRDELISMVVSGEVPPLARAGLPPSLRALRDGLLAADPSARLQSAEDALELLRRWPGYRNAADELADLVRGRSGVTAPRTGLNVDSSDELLEATDEPTVREGGAARAPALAVEDQQVDDSSLTTPRARASETLDELGGRRARRWRAPARLALGLALLGAGLGFGLAWTSGAAPETSASALSAAAALELATPSAGPETSPSQATLTASSAEPLDASVEAGAPEPAALAPEPSAAPMPDEATRERGAPSRAATTPATVEFAAHEFFFVWIKVDGHQHALEPVAKLELRPGRHKVWLRESANDPWVSAGRIEVAAGGRYRVSLEKPKGLELRKV